jgi:hypothetical protein
MSARSTRNQKLNTKTKAQKKTLRHINKDLTKTTQEMKNKNTQTNVKNKEHPSPQIQ